ETEAEIIVFCGVSFMAESAKILNPEKTVLLPVREAGCPMADMIDGEGVRALRRAHPGAAVVCYVNSSAEVKAESDICCTSSSALKIVRSLSEKEIIFIPDRNLGRYIAGKVPEKTFHFYEGYCPVHDRVTEADVTAAKAAHPGALFAVHPECREEVLRHADFIGSTSEILHYVETSPQDTFLIGTEEGVRDRLMQTAPDKQAHLVTPRFTCPNMKKTTTKDLLRALERHQHEVLMDAAAIDAASRPLKRMVAVR
ncbi:quinolinate synthase NadA, partial [Oscillospiraceae bacterium OttesenSCG-928-F05]|nr:quinolinate synthase NadA [Oscillospiraceae bacterium OttesenSCG-928-F05]